MGIALFTFAAVFVLVASGGLLVFFRAGLTQRLTATLSPGQDRVRWWDWLRPNRVSDSLRSAIQPFDRVLPKTPQEVGVARQRLIFAGFREDSHVRILYGMKVLLPIWFCLIVAVSDLTRQLSPLYAYPLALALGYLLPDFWLGRRITWRRTNIELALPDFLDLMVVCVEAGLSIDKALARTTEEMRFSYPDIADEMGLVGLEVRAGRPRVEAWRNLAERVPLPVMRTLITALTQADQFGTSVSKTLRVYSDGLRTQRRQRVEELAAKMPVKLVFPLVVFIFPSIFVVALGPSLLAIQEQFQKYFK